LSTVKFHTPLLTETLNDISGTSRLIVFIEAFVIFKVALLTFVIKISPITDPSL
jgi:hypothetical protein